MEQEVWVRRATQDDATWIQDLSARVQECLTASGSLQEIGPVSSSMVQTSIGGGFAFILEMKGSRLGSGFMEPLNEVHPNTKTIQYTTWGMEDLLVPLWYLHSFMIEPMEQGKGLGLVFLNGIRSLMKDQDGTVVLDCWAENSKLCKFYEKAGFIRHGNFPENDYEISVYVQTL